MADKSYIGKGKIYMAPVSGGSMTGAARPIGNCDILKANIAQEKKEVMDYTSTGGGKANSVPRITGVTLEISMIDIDKDNLALALRGATTANVGGAVADEAHVAYHGGLVRFDNIPDRTQTITITGSGGTPTYAENTDYYVTPAGIVPLSTGSIGDGANIEADYTSKTTDTVEALTEAATEYRLIFEGLNEAQSGDEVVVDVWRFKPDPAQSWDLIGDEFARLVINGEALQDATITAAGESKYMRAEVV